MNTEEFINKVCFRIKYKPARTEISKEIETHITDLKEEYMIKKNMREEEAETESILQMGDAEEIGKKLNKIHRPKINWILILLLIILIGFEFMITTFKSQYVLNPYIGNLIRIIKLGLILSIIIYFCNYRKIKKFSLIIYILATIIMLLQFTDMSLTINNQKFITLILGNTFFPPCILAVPLYVIAFAGFITDYKYENIKKIKNFNINFDLLRIFSLGIISILFMFLSQSLTNIVILTITYLVLTTVKIYKENIKSINKILLLYVVSFIIIFTMFFIFNILYNNSFIEFQNVNSQQQIIQEDILKNAKLIGETDLESFRNNESSLVEESNYTFLYLIGKVGIILSTILIFVILLISLNLLFCVKRINEKYGKNLVIGLSSIFILESIIHILSNLNSSFILNANLPLVTYGSVYFAINCIIFAIILSIYRQKDIYMYRNDNNSKYA